MSESTPALEFTGERFTPECVREIWYEHYHRYAFAQQLARGKRVLDAACGEGYGSALIASSARTVLGLDVSEQAIAHARARYAQPNLSFRQADVTALEHLPSGSFDLILSFETLEHLQAQESMLEGFRRLLAPEGLLLVSTPDKRNYSDIPQFHNEHHVRELYREEFEALLAGIFPYRRLFAQKLVFQSALWSLDAFDTPPAAATLSRDGTLEDGLAYPPLYYIAACALEPLPALPAVHLFGDAEESVYTHYYHEIRKNMAAGQRIQQLEAELAEARQRLRAQGQP